MKRIVSIILIIVSILAVLIINDKTHSKDEANSSQHQEINNNEEIIKVMEDVYIDYVNDISLDSEKYIGKTIEIEGMFIQKEDANGNKHMYVYRLGDVTINNHDEASHDEDSHDYQEVQDGELMYGLEFKYNSDNFKENDWIKVIGKIEEDNNQIVIEAKSVQVIKERGKEKVKSLY